MEQVLPHLTDRATAYIRDSAKYAFLGRAVKGPKSQNETRDSALAADPPVTAVGDRSKLVSAAVLDSR